MVTGVGTHIRTKSASLILLGSEVNSRFSFSKAAARPDILSSSMSNPITLMWLEKASARGRPTYPNPATQSDLSIIRLLHECYTSRYKTKDDLLQPISC